MPDLTLPRHIPTLRLPALGTRGFHRPLSDPRADLRLRLHGSERDGRNVPIADIRRETSKRLNSRAQGGAARSFGHSGKTKALDEPFNILRSTEVALISVV